MIFKSVTVEKREVMSLAYDLLALAQDDENDVADMRVFVFA